MDRDVKLGGSGTQSLSQWLRSAHSRRTPTHAHTHTHTHTHTRTPQRTHAHTHTQMLQAEKHRVLQVSTCRFGFFAVRNCWHCRILVQQANKHASQCVCTDELLGRIQCHIVRKDARGPLCNTSAPTNSQEARNVPPKPP